MRQYPITWRELLIDFWFDWDVGAQIAECKEAMEKKAKK